MRVVLVTDIKHTFFRRILAKFSNLNVKSSIVKCHTRNDWLAGKNCRKIIVVVTQMVS